MSPTEKEILLVEDNPDDEALTLRALKKSNILNKVIVARDGAEALDSLHGTGGHAGAFAKAVNALGLFWLLLNEVPSRRHV